MRRKISHTIRLRRIHANENDRLTNLQYFLIRLPLGRSKAALYFFASSENASAKIYRVVSFFPVKSRGSRVYAPSSSTLQQRQFPTWILPHFPGELSCHGSWDESLFFYLFQLGISSLMWLIFQTSVILCNKWRLLSKNHLLTWRCGKKQRRNTEEESCQCTFWPSDAYPLGFLTSRTPKETTLNSLFFSLLAPMSFSL